LADLPITTVMKIKDTKHRITLDVPTEFNDRLERLLNDVDATNKAELIRQALRVYEFIVKKTLEGCTFKVEHKNGDVERMTFLEIPQPVES
jgi:Arc/MetJ-type ribon-helix-helix transcriptional regulator